LIGGADSKNEGSENAGLWVQGDCRCRSPSLQLLTTRRIWMSCCQVNSWLKRDVYYCESSICSLTIKRAVLRCSLFSGSNQTRALENRVDRLITRL